MPPEASVIRLTTAKPKPCPLDFVVNNGVNSLVAILVFPTSDSQEPVQLIHQYYRANFQHRLRVLNGISNLVTAIVQSQHFLFEAIQR